MADSSNSSATSSTSSQSTGSQSTGSQTSSNASTSGATTSNSTGNFSGGLPGLGGQSWGSYTSSPSSETAAAHSSGVQGPGLANGNFGSSWSGNGNSGSGSGDYTYNNTSYSNNKSEPVMTVDEVYGKTETALGTSGNQSIVESQGDYAVTSNEKSNVETSTFGKQDNITVTPESVTENKGLIDNAAIDSIEGLNFQQKDKESQDVMEAKKSRDEAEAEDKANNMIDQLKAKTDETVDEKATNKFQIGDRDEDVAAAKAKADEAAQAYKDLQAKVDGKLAELNAAINERSKAETAILDANKNTAKKADFNDLKDDGIVTLSDGSEITKFTYVGKDPDVKAAYDARNEAIQNLVQADRAFAAKKSEYNSYVNSVNNAKAQADKANEAYNNMFTDGTKTAIEAQSYKTNIEAAKNEINNSNLSAETKAEANTVLDSVETAAGKMNDAANALAANPNDVNAVKQYVEETARYNKALKDAKGNNALKNTDFNKTFTQAVAEANDFTVTLADGTTQNYSEFAAEMATKSPELAAGLYKAKAAKLAEDGHKVLAAIENAKSKMVMTWLGSKLTQADNQVRAQFIQMAKTDMRATYATYDNVLSDPNASPEAKAEASAAINQANSLMTASAALQASTGFFSGIGDSMSDGVYGVTDPAALNAYQKTLNAIDNYTKITLGLGVTPGANKAYQNMYYIAGAKVNESGLFNKDFDGDGFALCQEYGNNAAAGMITGAGELATGIALFFNPAMSGIGLNLVIDSVQTFMNGLYGVQKDANKSLQYTQEVLSYFKEAESIASDTGNKEALDAISGGITQIENFELKSDEVENLDNWLEGSGSNTATNEKFNQSLSYDEWLKLIEADPTMRDYAKKLIAEKKEK